MKPDVLKHVMYFGLILGLVFSLNFFLSTLTGIFVLFSWLVTLAIPYLAYRMVLDCRERVLNGSISFGVAFIYGFQLFFYASLISGAFRFIFCQWLNPDYLAGVIESTMQLLASTNLIEMIEAQGLTEAEYASQIKMLLVPINMSFVGMITNVFIGSIVSVFTALIVKKEANPFQTSSPTV